MQDKHYTTDFWNFTHIIQALSTPKDEVSEFHHFNLLFPTPQYTEKLIVKLCKALKGLPFITKFAS